jgi:hypothetical protein
MTPAWMVYVWRPVLWRTSSTTPLKLVHSGTRVLSLGEDEGPRSGQTLWCNDCTEHEAGVAWDWVELRAGVVAMSDPMGMVTNLRMTNERGDSLSTMQMTLVLHRLVHDLPWQIEVTKILKKQQ